MPEFLRRETSADRLNDILNDPMVRPWVADMSEGMIDVSASIKNENNILLMGDYGGCLFFKLMPGVYEVHTQVLPSARGRWTTRLTKECAQWMFTRTDAYEVLTRVPEGHIGARAAALRQGMKYEFTRPNECKFRGKIGDVHIHSIRIQDWIPTAPYLVEIGAKFHVRLHEEAERLGVTETPHGDDENHNRYVGACFEMVLHGQASKAVALYNRWALVSRHPTVKLVSLDPPMIKFDIGYVALRDGRVEVTREAT